MTKKKVKKEASTVGGIKGFSAPFGVADKKKKKNPHQPFEEEADLFESSIIRRLLQPEVVRKKGNQWVMYDDETDVAIGTFPSRQAAWEKQRLMRRSKALQKKMKTSEKKRQKRAKQAKPVKKNLKTPKSMLAPVPVKAPKSVKAPKPRASTAYHKLGESKKRKFLFDKIKKVLLERGMMSYVFENTPVSDEFLIWDKFVSQLSKQIIMSDVGLKNILQKLTKAEIKTLNNAIDVIGDGLLKTKAFSVVNRKISKNAKTDDAVMNFTVSMKKSNKNVDFFIRLENGRPLIVFPDEARQVINTMANDESKLLRAELIHIQEVELDKMQDVVKIFSKRNDYLKAMEKKIDGVLNNLNLLEIAMTRYLLKSKFKGLK